jgi:hypothetical protein
MAEEPAYEELEQRVNDLEKGSFAFESMYSNLRESQNENRNWIL